MLNAKREMDYYIKTVPWCYPSEWPVRSYQDYYECDVCCGLGTSNKYSFIHESDCNQSQQQILHNLEINGLKVGSNI